MCISYMYRINPGNMCFITQLGLKYEITEIWKRKEVLYKGGRCNRALFSKLGNQLPQNTRARSIDYISSSHVTVFQPTRIQNKLEVCYNIKYCELRLPLKYTVQQLLRKKSIFELNLRPQLRSQIQTSVSTQLVPMMFFLPLFSCYKPPEIRLTQMRNTLFSVSAG